MVHYVYNVSPYCIYIVQEGEFIPYVQDPNPSVFVKTIGQLRICLHIILFKRTKMFLTVGGGVAGVIVYVRHPEDTVFVHNQLLHLGLL